MTLNKKNAAKWFLLLACAFTLGSCNQNEDFEEIDPDIPEPVYPVNFSCLTLNREGYTGEKASISYIAKDGNVYPDYLKEVNNVQINDRPCDVLQDKDKLYLLHGSYWEDNGFFEVNPNTFEIVRKFNLTNQLICTSMVKGNNDELIIAGEDHATDINMVIVSLTAKNDEESIVKRINTEFPIQAMERVGDKIFIASIASDAPLAVMDINNLSVEGMRNVLDACRLTNRNNKFVKDKNGNLWVANRAVTPITMVCFNPKTEKVVKEIVLPSTASTLNETAYTIDNNGTILYIRNHKAFYAIDINKDEVIDEPHYEYREHIGQLKDLKMNEYGKLLIINQRQESFSQSELIEFDPTAGNEWYKGKVNIGYQGTSIFVPRHEKSL